MLCGTCGSALPDGARFCPECGRPRFAPADERRIATVLFADLVGFTRLSEHRDPEQVKAMLDRCFAELAVPVIAYGGRVDQLLPALGVDRPEGDVTNPVARRGPGCCSHDDLSR